MKAGTAMRKKSRGEDWMKKEQVDNPLFCNMSTRFYFEEPVPVDVVYQLKAC